MKEKRQSVSSKLDEVERLIAKGIREEKGQDLLSLMDASPADFIMREGEEGDMRQALSRPEVRRVFLRIFKLGGLMESGADPNPVIIAFHAGKRELALSLYNAVKRADPAAFYQMEREYESNLKSREEKEEAQ